MKIKKLKNQVNDDNKLVRVGNLSYYHTKAEAEEDAKLLLKQNVTDNSLATNAKTIVGAINEVNSKSSAVYRPKPSVDTYSDLPLTGNEIGDVRNVRDTSMNYVWLQDEGQQPAWDAMGTTVDISGKVDKTTKINGHTLDADVTITKGDVGLGNVDNTSDANKPVSTAVQTALNGKQDELTPGTYISIDGSTDTIDVKNFAANSDIDAIFA